VSEKVLAAALEFTGKAQMAQAAQGHRVAVKAVPAALTLFLLMMQACMVVVALEAILTAPLELVVVAVVWFTKTILLLPPARRIP